MITCVHPDTIGALVPNDKIYFENDTENIYYFIGNFGVEGYVFWNDNEKKRKIITNFSYETYNKLRLIRINQTDCKSAPGGVREKKEGKKEKIK